MKRQRNTTQTRKTEVQINEEELGKLPEKEVRIIIVKVIKNLENKMKKQTRNTEVQINEEEIGTLPEK